MNSRSSRSFLSGPAEGAQRLNTGMTSKKSPHDQGELAKKALAERQQGITKAVEGRLKALRDEKTGKILAKLSDDDWLDVLTRTACGDYPANIARHFGITSAAINHKRYNDAEFDRLYKEARLEAAWAWGDDNLAIAAGIEGYSSGDVRRDELLVRTRERWLSKVNPTDLGDKLQIDQRTISINIDRDDEAGW